MKKDTAIAVVICVGIAAPAYCTTVVTQEETKKLHERSGFLIECVKHATPAECEDIKP